MHHKNLVSYYGVSKVIGFLKSINKDHSIHTCTRNSFVEKVNTHNLNGVPFYSKHMLKFR